MGSFVFTFLLADISLHSTIKQMRDNFMANLLFQKKNHSSIIIAKTLTRTKGGLVRTHDR